MAAMRRAALAVLATAALLVLLASPASAHATGGPAATDYRSRVTSIVPQVAGVTVRIQEVGGKLEATNTTSQELVVLGYRDEPYLRIGPDGVFRNERSPATYLNQTSTAQTPVPASADPALPPVWKKLSSGRTTAWHDHRTHWMGAQDPPQVQRDRGRSHVVYPDWTVALTLGGQPLVAHGTLTWVPGPSPVPWFALALVAAALLVGVALTARWASGLAVALVAAVAVDLVHVVAVAWALPGGVGTHLGALAASGLATVIGWVAAAIGVRLLLQGKLDGAYAAAVTGGVLALTGGLGDLKDLFRSQVPSVLSAGATRALVALSLGLGVGLVVAAVVAVQRHRPPPPADGVPAEDAAPSPVLAGSLGGLGGPVATDPSDRRRTATDPSGEARPIGGGTPGS